MIPLIRLDAPMLVFGGPYSNLQATEAVLAEAERRGIAGDRILCTGDVVAYAADAAACCDRMMASGALVLMGNCEENLAAEAEDCGCGFAEDTACDLLSRAWYAHANRQVSPRHRAWMGGLPRQLHLELPDRRRLAVLHGGANEISRFLFASTPEPVLLEELEQTGCQGVIAGHCGIPFARRLEGGGLWLNAGAVGMPANDGTPRAWFAVLTPAARSLTVEILALDYDHAAAAAAMRAAGLPEGYASGLETGLWPSCDVLPSMELAARGRALHPSRLVW
jgi:hypothetical protein